MNFSCEFTVIENLNLPHYNHPEFNVFFPGTEILFPSEMQDLIELRNSKFLKNHE